MLALSTQALSGDTDLQATMKSAVQFFITTLAAAMGLSMVGCGGGGGEPVYSEPTGTARLVSADSRIMSPKLMTVVGTDIYIANQISIAIAAVVGAPNYYDRSGVLKLTSTEVLSPVGFSGFYDGIGVSIDSNNQPYVSGKTVADGTAGIYSLNGSRLVYTSGSHYGFAFVKSDDLLAPSINLGNKLSISSATAYTTWTQLVFTETPQAFARKGNYLYFSTATGNIYKSDINNILAAPVRLTLTGLNLYSPNGIAFDGDVMYVVNYGPPAGTGSWIAKITNETTVTEFKKDINWLCASAGIAVRDNYIYVSNGTPATPGSCGTIPGTNTSIQNTIVKFFH